MKTTMMVVYRSLVVIAMLAVAWQLRELATAVHYATDGSVLVELTNRSLSVETDPIELASAVEISVPYMSDPLRVQVRGPVNMEGHMNVGGHVDIGSISGDISVNAFRDIPVRISN